MVNTKQNHSSQQVRSFFWTEERDLLVFNLRLWELKTWKEIALEVYEKEKKKSKASVTMIKRRTLTIDHKDRVYSYLKKEISEVTIRVKIYRLYERLCVLTTNKRVFQELNEKEETKVESFHPSKEQIKVDNLSDAYQAFQPFHPPIIGYMNLEGSKVLIEEMEAIKDNYYRQLEAYQKSFSS